MTDFKLSQIIVYPVKSLAGISLASAKVEARGLEHDRRWMLTDDTGRFLTQRELPRTALIQPMLGAECLTLTAPGLTPLQVPLRSVGPTQPVQVWRSRCEAVPVSAEADAWFTAFLGLSCRLMFMPGTTRRAVSPEHSAGEGIVSFADGYPVLLLGENSLADLNARLDIAVPMNRFRPNLVLSGPPAYAEDHWMELQIGTARFYGVKPCDRCVLTTVDQARGTRTGPEPMRTLATYRQTEQKVLFGRYLIPEAEGTVSAGDMVTILAAGG